MPPGNGIALAVHSEQLTTMFRSYFKTAVRSLLRYKGYSLLNITGLAAGIVCAALICLWVEAELTYNYEFKKHDRLYHIVENQTYNGKVSTFMATPGPMAEAIVQDIPGIAHAARISSERKEVFSTGAKDLNIKGVYADVNMFDMLNISFITGSYAADFNSSSTIVIGERMARNLFGSTNVVGRTIRMNHGNDYMITGVFRNISGNTTFRFEWIGPISVELERRSFLKTSWGANSIRTYVELLPGAAVEAVNRQLYDYLGTKVKTDTRCFLWAMNDWNLHNEFTDGRISGGRIKYVKLFSVIAIIIVVIACINFMNLSTARAEKRAREVGVRKVMGASRSRLAMQFLAESLVLSFIAVLLSVGILYLVLPLFNLVIDKQLSLQLFQPLHAGALIAIGLLTGLLAGSYPALYLSSFNPISVLKNLRLKTGSMAGLVRRGLVTVQFSISIILIIATIIVYQQISHVKSRNLGFDKDNVISLELQGSLKQHFDVVHKDLLETGLVADAALSELPMLQMWNNSGSYSWKGKREDQDLLVTFEGVSPQFLSTMNIQIKEGRNFRTSGGADSNSVIINRAMATQMGAEGRLGGIITNDRQFEIVGIVEDFLYNDMYAPGAPFLFLSDNNRARWLNIRFKQGADRMKAVAAAQQVITAVNPGYPFEFNFVDEAFNKEFRAEMLTGGLATIFSCLAIFISCLGLFGLAAYTAERRTKEIGIRKVMGASVAGLVKLLSSEFVKLVAISCLIAFPAAWWLMDHWLQQYQYHVNISWWVFGAAGITALLIALLTVSYQAMRAALMNPVVSLRAE
ncbi:MAG TPA: ABC transporter permease [Chitinophaga sp.]|uniref:ABC transporter permease n=1 Tax=Chitinophaga sp. TaxID=1869181 RepID=UPI002C408C07|nr:ABC transporter permease [Chitinophaga sp.]HVI44750.1 ABC transporter permease [Chitinophaga sp.]